VVAGSPGLEALIEVRIEDVDWHGEAIHDDRVVESLLQLDG